MSSASDWRRGGEGSTTVRIHQQGQQEQPSLDGAPAWGGAEGQERKKRAKPEGKGLLGTYPMTVGSQGHLISQLLNCALDLQVCMIMYYF